MLSLEEMGLHRGIPRQCRPKTPTAEEDKTRYAHIEPESITRRLARMEGPGIELGTELPWTINGKP